MREAIKELQIKAEYQMVADLNKMKARGLEYTPALEINGALVSQGQFYTLSEMKTLLLQHK